MSFFKKPVYFFYNDAFLGKRIKCAHIELKETIKFKGIPIRNINHYDVDANQIHDSSHYHDPFDDPDYNFRNLKKKYDEKINSNSKHNRIKSTSLNVTR